MHDARALIVEVDAVSELFKRFYFSSNVIHRLYVIPFHEEICSRVVRQSQNINPTSHRCRRHRADFESASAVAPPRPSCKSSLTSVSLPIAYSRKRAERVNAELEVNELIEKW